MVAGRGLAWVWDLKGGSASPHHLLPAVPALKEGFLSVEGETDGDGEGGCGEHVHELELTWPWEPLH